MAYLPSLRTRPGVVVRAMLQNSSALTVSTRSKRKRETHVMYLCCTLYIRICKLRTYIYTLKTTMCFNKLRNFKCHKTTSRKCIMINFTMYALRMKLWNIESHTSHSAEWDHCPVPYVMAYFMYYFTLKYKL